MTNEEAATLIQSWLDGDPLPNEECLEHAVKVLRSPAPGAAELLKRWQDAALDHYTPGWAFDPTNPELMIGNIARETHVPRSPVAPGAVAMREAAARLCNLRSCTWSKSDDERSQDFREGIETAAHQLRDAIRALPAPEVPEVIQTWCKNYDATEDCGGLDWARNSRLRDHFRKEYGI